MKNYLNRYHKGEKGQAMVECILLLGSVFIVFYFWLIVFYNIFEAKQHLLQTVNFGLWERAVYGESAAGARPVMIPSKLKNIMQNYHGLNMPGLKINLSNNYVDKTVTDFIRRYPGFAFFKEKGFYKCDITLSLKEYIQAKMNDYKLDKPVFKMKGLGTSSPFFNMIKDLEMEERGALVTNSWKTKDRKYVVDRVKETYSPFTIPVMGILAGARIVGIDPYPVNLDRLP